MIFEILSQSINAQLMIKSNDGNQIGIRIDSAKKAMLPGKIEFSILVLYCINNRTINFESAANAIIDYLLNLANEKAIKIRANWIIVGRGAGIYLFEEINKSGNANYRGMRNAFCTIDTDNGKSFFELATPTNDKVSKEYEELFTKASKYSIDEFKKAFRESTDKVIDYMNQKRRYAIARVIQ